MKKILITTCVVLLTLIALSACQTTTPTPPADMQTSEPTDLPAPPTIEEDNAAVLKVVFSQELSTGYANLTWTYYGDAFWLVDRESAVLYNSETANQIGQFAPGTDSAIFDVSSDRKTIAYASGTDDIRIYDLEAGTDTVVITTGFPYSTAFFSPDSQTLAVPSLMDIKVVFFDVDTGNETGDVSGFSTAAPVYNAEYSPDGKTLLWFSRGTVQPMEIATQMMGPALSHEDFISSLSISPDGKVIATTAAGTVDGEFLPVLTLWNAANGNVLAQIVIPTYSTANSFSADSNLIAVASEGGFLIFTSPYGDEVARYDSTEPITDVEFSPDGTRLATVSDSGLLQIYTP